MARPNSAKAIGAYIEGMKEVKARFAALPSFMQQKRIDVNSATAAAVALGAQQRLIASPSVQTRNLLNHVKWKISKSSGVATVGVTSGSTMISVSRIGPAGRFNQNVRVKGIVIAGKFGNRASKAAGAKLIRPSRYAHLVEFGTVHFEAEAFMKPATAAQKDAHLHRWRAAGKQLEREMANIGGGIVPTSSTSVSIGGGFI